MSAKKRRFNQPKENEENESLSTEKRFIDLCGNLLPTEISILIFSFFGYSNELLHDISTLNKSFRSAVLSGDWDSESIPLKKSSIRSIHPSILKNTKSIKITELLNFGDYEFVWKSACNNVRKIDVSELSPAAFLKWFQSIFRFGKQMPNVSELVFLKRFDAREESFDRYDSSVIPKMFPNLQKVSNPMNLEMIKSCKKLQFVKVRETCESWNVFHEFLRERAQSIAGLKLSLPRVDLDKMLLHSTVKKVLEERITDLSIQYVYHVKEIPTFWGKFQPQQLRKLSVHCAWYYILIIPPYATVTELSIFPRILLSDKRDVLKFLIPALNEWKSVTRLKVKAGFNFPEKNMYQLFRPEQFEKVDFTFEDYTMTICWKISMNRRTKMIRSLLVCDKDIRASFYETFLTNDRRNMPTEERQKQITKAMEKIIQFGVSMKDFTTIVLRTNRFEEDEMDDLLGNEFSMDAYNRVIRVVKIGYIHRRVWLNRFAYVRNCKEEK